MMKEIFLIRHGRTTYNRLGIWQGSGVDSPLDELGRQQANLFFKAYENVDFDLIIHSTLQRSKQTVSPFAQKGIPAMETNLINEISWGRFEGKAHTEESLNTYNHVIAQWQKDNYHIGFPEGESAIDLGERIERFVSELREIDQQKILICSHGRAIRALMCIMKNEPLKEMEKYQHANTGLFKANYKDGQFHFTEINSIAHLVSLHSS